MKYTEHDRQRRLEKMRRLAKDRGGVCLSKHFVDNKTKLRWRCAEGHEWEAISQNVIRNHWCMICGNERQGRSKAHTIELMHKVAAAKAGECLSRVYRNNTTKLRWRCKHGHEWEAVPSSILGSGGHIGTWCPICAGKLPKEAALSRLVEIAESRGGKLISTKYRDIKTKLRWCCAQGHKWDAIPESVILGTWCPDCGGSNPLTLGDMIQTARQFGGKCLSKRYVNSSQQILWRCAEGHEWKAKPTHVRAGHWCPICSQGVSERICRAILEQITGVEFPKQRPAWLKNKRGRNMELDGYAKSIGVAFEYHGLQHYRKVPFFHSGKKNLAQQQQDDAQKRTLCHRHGVTLIEVPRRGSWCPVCAGRRPQKLQARHER